VVDEVEQQRALVSAHVLIDAKLAPILGDRFGRHSEVTGRAGDGRLRLRVAAPTPLMIAQHLAGWGALIEVTDPPAVRAELARLGAELVARYA